MSDAEISESAPLPTSKRWGGLVLGLLVLTLWWFPKFWYTYSDDTAQFVWFGETKQVEDWQYEEIPVGEAAESILVADSIFNGKFIRETYPPVNVYSAKRYLGKENEIGLFSHTPDRCWTATGWKVVPTEKSFIEFSVHGTPMLFERRIFSNGRYNELVYFGALVGGRPLPYRLDQYHSFAKDRGESGQNQSGGTLNRLGQSRVWGWALESFTSRTPLAGPQQFIRVSTAMYGQDEAPYDGLLQKFLEDWLVPTDYGQEFEQWKIDAAQKLAQEKTEETSQHH